MKEGSRCFASISAAFRPVDPIHLGNPGFNVYVCDRLVLPGLHNRLAEVAAGTLSLDRETRDYIRGNLCFRFIEVPDGATAATMERDVRRGRLAVGKPLLNPL